MAVHSLQEPRGSTLDGWIMSRKVAYAVLCLLVVAARGNGELNRVERGAAKKDHDPWSYDEEKTGPSHWPALFQKCGGSQQSPVNIDTKELDPSEDLDAIDFINYDDDLDDATMTNNGHTVVVKPGEKDDALKITDGGLDDEFKLLQIHFHWGSDSKQGSEHTIDGKRFPLEMHMVHINTKYKTEEAARNKEDGLAVLAVLFKIDDDDNEDLEPIIDKLDEVKNEDVTVELDDVNVHKLLPDDLFPYYRYEGSLTTPPCNEAVIWTVFSDFATISEKQIQKFRDLKEKEPGEASAESLINNYRPTQPLHNRVIEISTGSAQNIFASLSMTLGLSALALALTYFNRV